MDVWHALDGLTNLIGEGEGIVSLTQIEVLDALDAICPQKEGTFSTLLGSYKPVTTKPCWTDVWIASNGVKIRAVLELSGIRVFVMIEDGIYSNVHEATDVDNMIDDVKAILQTSVPPSDL